MAAESAEKKLFCPACGGRISADKLGFSLVAPQCPRCGAPLDARELYRSLRLSEPDMTQLAAQMYHLSPWYQLSRLPLEGEGLDGKPYQLVPRVDAMGRLSVRAGGTGELLVRSTEQAARFSAFGELFAFARKLGGFALPNLVLDWQGPAGNRKWGRLDCLLLLPKAAICVQVLPWHDHVFALDPFEGFYRCNWDEDPYGRSNPYFSTFKPADHGFVRAGSVQGIRQVADATATLLGAYAPEAVLAVSLFVGSKSFTGGMDEPAEGVFVGCLDEGTDELFAVLSAFAREGGHELSASELHELAVCTWEATNDVDARRTALGEGWRDGNVRDHAAARERRRKERPAPQVDGTFVGGEHAEDRFCDLRFSGARFSALELADCVFERCVFEECVFDGCTVSGCEFEDCTVVNPRFSHTTVSACGFTGCQLVGVAFSLVANDVLSGPIDYLADTLVKYGTFDVMDLRKTDFSRAELASCTFANANLEQASFKAATLEGTQFVACDLRKADFRNAVGYTVDATSCRLGGARFSLPEARCLIESLGAKVD